MLERIKEIKQNIKYFVVNDYTFGLLCSVIDYLDDKNFYYKEIPIIINNEMDDNEVYAIYKGKQGFEDPIVVPVQELGFIEWYHHLCLSLKICIIKK